MCDNGEIQERLALIETRLAQLAEGVNTIGSMMNQASDGINSLFEQVSSGGLFKMLGSLRGGN